MSALVATEQIDDRVFVETRDGQRGTRVYRVNTGNADVAILGNSQGPPVGLPKKGDPWDAISAKYLVVTGRKTKRLGGQDTDLVNKTNAWTLVTVRYETLGLDGSFPPPNSGLSFTKLSPTTVTILAKFGIDPNTGYEDGSAGQIDNGQGRSVDVGMLNFEVYSPLSPTQTLPLGQLVALHTFSQVNDDTVNLPPLLRKTVGFTFSKGQLRFAGFTVEDPDETGWRFVRYSLKGAVDHKARWFLEGQDGKTTGEVKEAFLYTYGDFSGLW